MWNEKHIYKNTRVKSRYTIGEIKQMYSLGADSLRYYERKGLLNPMRGENDYRYYGETELYKLNVIKSLRAIDLSVDQICEYLNNRTIRSTLRMLRGVLDLLGARIHRLETFAEEVRMQIADIEAADSFPCDIVTVNMLPDRPVFLMEESYASVQEYSALRRELIQSNDLPFSVIGDKRVGSAISMERIAEGDFTTYDCLFILDQHGTFRIPGGLYLTIRYRGAVQSEKYVRILMDYAARNNYKVIGPVLEWCYLDIHTTDLQSEAVMENQLLVEL